MKQLKSGRGRTSLRLDYLTIKKDGTYARNAYPIVVRAKYNYEPELRPLEDDPGCNEWFEFETLYVYEVAHFIGDDGRVLTVHPHEDLTQYLDDSQLDVVEKAVREYKAGDFTYPALDI